jgi:hypothetical protein
LVSQDFGNERDIRRNYFIHIKEISFRAKSSINSELVSWLSAYLVKKYMKK